MYKPQTGFLDIGCELDEEFGILATSNKVPPIALAMLSNQSSTNSVALKERVESLISERKILPISSLLNNDESNDNQHLSFSILHKASLPATSESTNKMDPVTTSPVLHKPVSNETATTCEPEHSESLSSEFTSKKRKFSHSHPEMKVDIEQNGIKLEDSKEVSKKQNSPNSETDVSSSPKKQKGKPVKSEAQKNATSVNKKQTSQTNREEESTLAFVSVESLADRIKQKSRPPKKSNLVLIVGQPVEFWFDKNIPQYKRVLNYNKFISSWQPGIVSRVTSDQEVNIDFMGSNLKASDKRILKVSREMIREPSSILAQESKKIMKQLEPGDEVEIMNYIDLNDISCYPAEVMEKTSDQLVIKYKSTYWNETTWTKSEHPTKVSILKVEHLAASQDKVLKGHFTFYLQNHVPKSRK